MRSRSGWSAARGSGNLARVARVTLIGYWRNDAHPEWPDPHDFVDETWDGEERELVARYLREGFVPWVALGYSPCRICGKPNGSAEYTDGVFIWPEGLSHYVKEHSVRLPRRVVDHVLAQIDALHPETVDRSWWLNVTPEDR